MAHAAPAALVDPGVLSMVPAAASLDPLDADVLQTLRQGFIAQSAALGRLSNPQGLRKCAKCYKLQLEADFGGRRCCSACLGRATALRAAKRYDLYQSGLDEHQQHTYLPPGPHGALDLEDHGLEAHHGGGALLAPPDDGAVDYARSLGLGVAEMPVHVGGVSDGPDDADLDIELAELEQDTAKVPISHVDDLLRQWLEAVGCDYVCRRIRGEWPSRPASPRPAASGFLAGGGGPGGHSNHGSADGAASSAGGDGRLAAVAAPPLAGSPALVDMGDAPTRRTVNHRVMAFQELVCHRAGRYRPRLRNSDNVKRRGVGLTKKVDCPARLVLRRYYVDPATVYITVVGEHDHHQPSGAEPALAASAATPPAASASALATASGRDLAEASAPEERDSARHRLEVAIGRLYRVLEELEWPVAETSAIADELEQLRQETSLSAASNRLLPLLRRGLPATGDPTEPPARRRRRPFSVASAGGAVAAKTESHPELESTSLMALS